MKDEEVERAIPSELRIARRVQMAGGKPEQALDALAGRDLVCSRAAVRIAFALTNSEMQRVMERWSNS